MNRGLIVELAIFAVGGFTVAFILTGSIVAGGIAVLLAPLAVIGYRGKMKVTATRVTSTNEWIGGARNSPRYPGALRPARQAPAAGPRRVPRRRHTARARRFKLCFLRDH